MREAREAIEGIDDPQEAWETLAARGFLPADWCDNDARQFQAGPPVTEVPIGIVRGDYEPGETVHLQILDQEYPYRPPRRFRGVRVFRAAERLRAGDFVVQCGRFDVRVAERARWSAHPPSLDAVLAFASDIARASAAEMLAREHFGERERPLRWRAIFDDELEHLRDNVIALARGASLPRELRAVFALGYFAKGLDREGSIELLCPERIDDL